MTRQVPLFLASLLLALVPHPALAQATSWSVGGPFGVYSHQANILNCCGHFAEDFSNVPGATVIASGPPWEFQPAVTDQYGSARAVASTRSTSASERGVSLTATIAGNSIAGPSGGLRAFATVGTASVIYYSFVLTTPAYVELHGSVTRARSGDNPFGASFSLRQGFPGSAISGFEFTVHSGMAPDFRSHPVHAGPVLLGPGEYFLVGGMSGDVTGSPSAAFSIQTSLTLSIHDTPDGVVVGTVIDAEGDVAVDGQSASNGDDVRTGDVIEGGPDSRVLICMTSGRCFGFAGGGELQVNEYLFVPDNPSGSKETYNIPQGLFQHTPAPGDALDTDVTIITPSGITDLIGITTVIGEIQPIPLEPTIYWVPGGGVAVTPWENASTSEFEGPTAVHVTPTGATASPFSQDTYDLLEDQITGADTQSPAITSANEATFTAGSLWSFTVTTTGSPTASLNTTGTLPTGVAFADNGDGTATISGASAPGTGGSYPIVITAENSGGTATQNFTLHINASFVVDRGVVLGANVVIGPGTWIKQGAQIGNNAVIGANVLINRDVVVGAGVHIGDNTVLDQGTMIGTDATIGASVRLGQYVQVAASAVIPDGAVIRARASVP